MALYPRMAEGGRSLVELTVENPHLRSHAIAHGGVFATLLDAAQGMAAASVAPSGFDVVTVQLNVNFIRPAGVGETLVARGEVVHAGRRTAVTRGEIRTAAGDLAATGSATLMFLTLERGAAQGGLGLLPPENDGGG
jgi:uncharacterized protein (TIGR00369 family)